MLAAPPWMRTNSGYFFVESKLGGSAMKLWIFSPRLLVNQNSRSGCQLICATRSSVKCDSAVHLPLLRSMRPTSAGWTADCQVDTTIVVAGWGTGDEGWGDSEATL